MNVHKSFICNRPKLESTQMSFNNERLDTLWYIHTMKYYAALKRNELLVDTSTWTSLYGIIGEKK